MHSISGAYTQTKCLMGWPMATIEMPYCSDLDYEIFTLSRVDMSSRSEHISCRVPAVCHAKISSVL